MHPKIIEYRPSYVKIPAGLKKELPKDPYYGGQQENKKHDPNYDDYSLFYDLFFDMDRKNIWTVGPPLFSLEREFVKVDILYNGKPLRYMYKEFFPPKDYSCYTWEYFNPHSACSACFRIPATGINEDNPTLTFRTAKKEFTARVASFPAVRSQALVLSTLQKNYSAKHIVEWVLWHYVLFEMRSIFLYDNNSDNIATVQRALEEINAPGLDIVIIRWPYYYGGSSLRFDDLFAQQTQLHHSLRLCWGRKQYVANFDMDEFLVRKREGDILKILKRNKPYLSVPRYDAVDTTEKEPSGLEDCAVRERVPLPLGKYIFYSKEARYISDPHCFRFTNQFLPLCHLRYFWSIIKNYWRSLNLIRHASLYLIHTGPIKIIWKDDEWVKKERDTRAIIAQAQLKRMDLLWDQRDRVARRPNRTRFNPAMHVIDIRVQSGLERVRQHISKG